LPTSSGQKTQSSSEHSLEADSHENSTKVAHELKMQTRTAELVAAEAYHLLTTLVACKRAEKNTTAKNRRNNKSDY